MTLKTERELLKKEVTKLRRENTRLANANVNLNNTINANLVQAATHEALVERHGELQEELSSIKAAKNNIVEESSSLKRTISSQVDDINQLEATLHSIQEDLRVACELMYGADFDPSNIDRLMPMMSNGVEYVPRAQAEGVGGYVEPMQRLVRMIWRRTHWGLNPLVLNNYGQTPL